jgi:DNA-directed RNA polymerase subunit beta
LFRAIGYETDKDILEIFDLADEFKVSKGNMKKAQGRKLAARVLKTWIEDFVDEDTGEVVSIERNEVLLDRETILGKRTFGSDCRRWREIDYSSQREYQHC